MTARAAAAMDPPIMAAQGWLKGVTFPPDRPLINVSQAAPVDPPPEPLRDEMARIVLHEPDAHLYGPVLGLPDLRAEVARQWSAGYVGMISPDQVAITSGCNQAYSAALMAIAGEGDEVILPVPWYFNHAMWNQMIGVRTVPLTTGPDMIPRAEDAARLVTSRTRAIALVSPNNPTGSEYPAETLAAFHDLARSQGLALIVDETYRDFDARTGAPHQLFAQREWDDTLIQLYSFSKAFRLTGHRVGAMLASPARLATAEKFLDTVTICPNQLGQRAALWGMQNLRDWVAGERAEILDRRQAVADAFLALADTGWRLRGCGAYFAWLEHPFAASSDDLAPALVRDAGVLMLPGTMFMPPGDQAGRQTYRMAFANTDRTGIAEVFARLSKLDWPKRG